MASSERRLSPTSTKYKPSRRGKKLKSDDQRMLVALPKDCIPERTWAELLQKEETDLMLLSIREEIIEEAMDICYQKYMEKQTAFFTVHCAAQAWLKLINWNFYRHDPGEDPTAYPPCYIPKRRESWIPDELPAPSPKDTWCKEDLDEPENVQGDVMKKTSSDLSLEMPFVEEIPKEYWFPGKVNVCVDGSGSRASCHVTDEDSSTSSQVFASEVLQYVTDYSNTEVTVKTSKSSGMDATTSASSLLGAGDSTSGRQQVKTKLADKSKVFSKSVLGRSKLSLPPLNASSRSHVSIISDCRLRNLRMETQYEVSSEKIDSPTGEPKRK